MVATTSPYSKRKKRPETRAMSSPGIIMESDIIELRRLCGEVGFDKPSAQIEKAMLFFIRGMSPTAAAREVGMSKPETFTKWLNSAQGNHCVAYFREKIMEGTRIDLESVTAMFLDAYHKATTAGEMVAATKELAQLHGLYPGKGVTVNNNTVNIVESKDGEVTGRQIERMTDEQLKELAGQRLLEALQEPEAVVVIEGEVVEESDG